MAPNSITKLEDNTPKLNYNIYNKKLLGIVIVFKE